MRVREAIAEAAARLEAIPGIPRLDAERLMAAALGVDYGAMLLAHLDGPVPPGFEALVRRRLAREPMGYVIGKAGFWTIEIAVGPGVLIPRADSESLIEAAIAHFGARGPARILDLGTGPGTLLLAALAQWPGASGLGIDASADALSYACANAERLGLAPRAEFRHGDWTDGLEARFDLVLCNPPYVESRAGLPPDVAEWEPPIALFGGEDGLAHYRTLAPRLRGVMMPGGAACLEIGAGQGESVRPLLRAQGFTIESRNDLNGVERCLVVTA